jgi:cytochrome c oxidase subunit 2
MWGIPLFPDQASLNAHHVDELYYFLVAVSAFFSVLIFGLIAVFAVRYRQAKRVNRRIEFTHFLGVEITWILIPLAISGVIFVWGAKVYFDLSAPPADVMDVYVIGKQWMWKIQHPEGNREINELHVPIGRAVRLTMTSQDVIHSFYIPAFRIKQDVLPGRYTSQWFHPTKVGEYHLFCAEYCGTLHSGMIGRVVVMEPAEYEQWLAGATDGASMAGTGEQLFTQFGCSSCHRAEVGARGPSLIGVYGSRVSIEGGQTVVADENYIRESILDPFAKIVLGYPRLMPTFRGRLSQEQLNQIIEYIKSLGSGQTGVPAAIRATPDERQPAGGTRSNDQTRRKPNG